MLTLSWLLSGLLPTWVETRDLARLVPWYWYSGPNVLVGGLDLGYLSLTLGVTVALLTLGVLSFLTRDLTPDP